MTEAEFARLQEHRRLAGRSIGPETAETFWAWGQILDPYGDEDSLPEESGCIGRIYFARAPGGQEWVSFNDLPEATRKALWKRVDAEEPSVLEFWNQLQAERPAIEAGLSQFAAAYQRASRPHSS